VAVSACVCVLGRVVVTCATPQTVVDQERADPRTKVHVVSGWGPSPADPSGFATALPLRCSLVHAAASTLLSPFSLKPFFLSCTPALCLPPPLLLGSAMSCSTFCGRRASRTTPSFEET
jgi:hypothetical protein